MPEIADVTPLVFLVVALVALSALLVLFIQVGPPAEPEARPPLLTQPYAAGETVEQPTPYYAAPVPESPDPLEVAGNLDRKALLGVAMVLGVFAMLGAYYTLATGLPLKLLVPGFETLMARASETQLDVSAERGAHLYASLCFDCHGKRGQGDVGVGLPLNKPDFRAACGPQGESRNGKNCKPTDTQTILEKPGTLAPDDQKIYDLVSRTIARGRQRPAPAYSMPAWAREEGGQLIPEQVRQLALFIMYGDWERPLQYRQEKGLALEPAPPPPPKPASPLDTAKAVVQQQCIACHSFQAGTNSPNPQAPNLAKYGAEGPFVDQLKALKASGDPNWLKKWVSDAPSIKTGTAMPAWKGILSEQQIDAVVEYLFSLK